MGCSWKTVDGKRIKISGVSMPRLAAGVGSLGVQGLLDILGAATVSGSPTLTREQLKDATMRLWLDPELGYIMESRLTPESPPIHHSISPSEAAAWQALRPTPAFIAHMFQPAEFADTVN